MEVYTKSDTANPNIADTESGTVFVKYLNLRLDANNLKSSFAMPTKGELESNEQEETLPKSQRMPVSNVRNSTAGSSKLPTNVLQEWSGPCSILLTMVPVQMEYSIRKVL